MFNVTNSLILSANEGQRILKEIEVGLSSPENNAFRDDTFNVSRN